MLVKRHISVKGIWCFFDKTSGAIRGNEEIQAKKEAILSDDKYDRMRAKDGARFNLSSKEQRIGDTAHAIGKGTPAGVLAMIPGVGPVISALITWGSTAGANAKQKWKEGEGEVSADKAIGYGTLTGAIEGTINYFGNRLFDSSTLKGAGNRIVAKMAETSGGQALLNTFGATVVDTGMELFTAVLKDTIKTWYNPKAERMSEEELQKMVYTSLVANLVINGMQNFVAYQRGLVADTGPSEADERAMMRDMAGEEPEAEAPKSRPAAEAEEAEMMGAMEDNIKGRAETDAEIPGRQRGEQEPLMLPAGENENPAMLTGPEERKMLPAAEERKMLPAGEERKLLPSGESDEKTMMAAFESNTGQNQPIGMDAEMPASAKTGETPFIEGAKDKTAEEIAGAVAQENGIPLPTQTAQPGVTTGASAGNSDILKTKVQRNEQLMKELAESGVKYSPDDVIMLAKTKDGKLLWLETGNEKNGLRHIIKEHSTDFQKRGVYDIPEFLERTLEMEPIKIGSNARGYYANYVVDGKKYKVIYGFNGYIVSFYPVKMK